VLTISPRKDYEIYDDDLREAMVTCTIQIPVADPFWKTIPVSSRNKFMNDFLMQLLDLREFISNSRFEQGTEERPVSQGVVTHPTSSNTSAAVASNASDTNVFHKESKSPMISTGSRPSIKSSAITGGVTTVQPGLENVGDIKKPSMLSRLSRQNSSKPAIIDRSSSLPDKPQPRSLSKDKDIDFSQRSSRRSPAVNTVACALRTEIANKEFEFGRLDRMLSKKSSTINIDTDSIPETPSELKYVQLKNQADDLLKEVAKLKQQYVELTGVRYEQSRSIRRRFGKSTQARLDDTNTHSAELVVPPIYMPSNAALSTQRIAVDSLVFSPSVTSPVNTLGTNIFKAKSKDIDDGIATDASRDVLLFKNYGPPHWISIQ
jgi:hypothetical protein